MEVVKMAQKKVYDKEFKIQAVKLGREIGFSKAAKELGINMDTLYGSDARYLCGQRRRAFFLCSGILPYLSYPPKRKSYVPAPPFWIRFFLTFG